MNQRWILSQFVTDPMTGMLIPVCASYGGDWVCPLHPTDQVNGWALVLIWISLHQLQALAQDARCVVLPNLYDQTPVPAQLMTAYAAHGMIATMTLAQTLSQLSTAEPAFGVAPPYRKHVL